MNIKISIYIIFSFLLVLFSCKATSNFSLNSLKTISASHQISNKKILEPLKKAVGKVKENRAYNIVLVKIDSINQNESNIYIKSSNFSTEQMYVSVNKTQDRPKGYLFIDSIPVLIYHDVSFFFNQVEKPTQILKTKNKDFGILLDIHAPYKHYKYEKTMVYGDVYENIKLSGEYDNITLHP